MWDLIVSVPDHCLYFYFKSYPVFHIYTRFYTEGYFEEWVWSVINLNEMRLSMVKRSWKHRYSIICQDF